MSEDNEKSTPELIRLLLKRHWRDLLCYDDLIVSTFIFGRIRNAINNVTAFSFFAGWPSSELVHLVMLSQVGNLLVLKWFHPEFFKQKLAGLLLLPNLYYLSSFFVSLMENLGTRAHIASELQHQTNIVARAGVSWYAKYVALIPLMSIARRFTKLERKEQVYADMSKIDPGLMKKFSHSSKSLRMLNIMTGRGSIQNWLKLDVIVREDVKENSPVFCYIHGGGWSVGDKFFNGMSIVQRLASRGVVVVSINYRLCPDVLIKDCILDCKRALGWIKANISKYKGDPNKIILSGESAGGHLCALLGVTANLKEFQPPEDLTCDTSVMATVPIYGVFDFSDEKGHLVDLHPSVLPGIIEGGFKPFLEVVLFQKKIDRNDDDVKLCSPMYHVMNNTENRKIGPFLIFHGTKDSLASLEDSKRFFDELTKMRKNSNNNQLLNSVSDSFIPVIGGHHAFGLIPTPRALAVADCIFDFIQAVVINNKKTNPSSSSKL